MEGEWNAGSISGSLQNSEAITTTQTNRRIEDRDGTQQMGSSVIVNERRFSFYGLESLSENVVDIRQLEDPGQRENTQIISYTTPHEEYLTTYTLHEDDIVIRFIEEYPPVIENTINLYYVQIIWNSIFTWRQILQHVQDSTQQFNFIPEIISVGRSNGLEAVLIDKSKSREAVDALPEVVIIRREDNEVVCAVCHDTFTNGETANQLKCTHLFHSNCILHWFRRKINCPTFRDEPAPPLVSS